MPLVIDGNNVIGNSKYTEDELIRVLARVVQSKKNRLLLFFDGERSHGQKEISYGYLRIRYSGVYQNADNSILDFLSGLQDKNSWQLVTDDRQLTLQAKDLGCKSQKVKQLLLEINKFVSASQAHSSNDKPIFEPDKEDLLRSMLGNKQC